MMLPPPTLSVTKPLLTNWPPATTRFWPCRSIPATKVGSPPDVAVAGVPTFVWLPPLKLRAEAPTLVNNVVCPLPTVAGANVTDAVGLKIRDIHLTSRSERDRPGTFIGEAVEVGVGARPVRVNAGGHRQGARFVKFTNWSAALLETMATVGKAVVLTMRAPVVGAGGEGSAAGEDLALETGPPLKVTVWPAATLIVPPFMAKDLAVVVVPAKAKVPDVPPETLPLPKSASVLAWTVPLKTAVPPA